MCIETAAHTKDSCISKTKIFVSEFSAYERLLSESEYVIEKHARLHLVTTNDFQIKVFFQASSAQKILTKVYLLLESLQVISLSASCFLFLSAYSGEEVM